MHSLYAVGCYAPEFATLSLSPSQQWTEMERITSSITVNSHFTWNHHSVPRSLYAFPSIECSQLIDWVDANGTLNPLQNPKAHCTLKQQNFSFFHQFCEVSQTNQRYRTQNRISIVSQSHSNWPVLKKDSFVITTSINMRLTSLFKKKNILFHEIFLVLFFGLVFAWRPHTNAAKEIRFSFS